MAGAVPGCPILAFFARVGLFVGSTKSLSEVFCALEIKTGRPLKTKKDGVPKPSRAINNFFKVRLEIFFSSCIPIDLLSERLV